MREQCSVNRCSDQVKRAYEKIAKDSKCKPSCCIGITGGVGPTGPTGPTGPAAATITVNSTTTTDPGTNAMVVNSGTSSNVILDFFIPRGNIGPTGATGSTPTFAIGNVSTGAPGTSASVSIREV